MFGFIHLLTIYFKLESFFFSLKWLKKKLKYKQMRKCLNLKLKDSSKKKRKKKKKKKQKHTPDVLSKNKKEKRKKKKSTFQSISQFSLLTNFHFFICMQKS